MKWNRPSWTTGNHSGNGMRITSYVWQRRLLMICWLFLAFAVFLPAVVASIDENYSVPVYIGD